jgi:Uma2 family endonuclease
MMSTSVKITVEQYDDMIKRGEFVPREAHRVELIRGEIVPIDPRGPMSPINPPHDNAVDELIEWSTEEPHRRAIRVRAQGAISIPELSSQPQPDLVWMVRRNYSKTRPKPEDVLLLLEVSDTTLSKDRGEKAELYAEAGIRDYWIININDQCIEVRRDPVGSTYRSITIYRPGQVIHPLAFPEVSLPVSRLFSE